MSDQNDHIPFEQLLAYSEGYLSLVEQAMTERHLASCTRCAADWIWLRRIGDLIRTGRAEQPPSDAVMRVRALFRAKRKPPIRWVTATLRFDSSRSPIMATLRGVPGEERQLLFDAKPFALDLRVNPQDSDWVLSGQVLGPETAGGVVITGPAGTADAPLDNLCAFRLPPIPAGHYKLRLRLGEFEIIIPDMEIGRA